MESFFSFLKNVTLPGDTVESNIEIENTVILAKYRLIYIGLPAHSQIARLHSSLGRNKFA